ncbi:MAG: hypothetical protein KIS78_37625 [Labilithrix sp.]|nr:hypothetical protein [Labilithrix sp.]MCW5838173.1 hypothetical protein [Labilithrix sp.]
MRPAYEPTRDASSARARSRWVLLAAGALLVLFAACAGTDDDGGAAPIPDGGAPEGSAIPDARADDAEASADVDAEAIRCSGELCLVDLPNAAVYGLTRWVFAGVVVDPVIGAWAIANGVDGDEAATAQVLHFEGGGWKVVHSARLAVSAETKSVRLSSLASDGQGHIVAVGTARSEPTGVILRSDGQTFTVTAFDEDLRAVWASESSTFVAGGGGRIFRAEADGGWADESAETGDFLTIWGTGPDDLYVAGSKLDEDFGMSFGHIGHRAAGDAGAPAWSFQSFAPPAAPFPGLGEIGAGVTAGARRFFSTREALASWKDDDGEPRWIYDELKLPVPLRGFWARSQSEIWAVGEIGRVYRFDGTTWKDAFLVFNGAPLTAPLTAVGGTSAGEVFFVGDGVALRRAAP